MSDIITSNTMNADADGDREPKQQQQQQQIKLAIRNDGVGPTLPIIKRRLGSSEPPAFGRGLRIAMYQGPILCGDQRAIQYNVSQLDKWAKHCSDESNMAQLLVVGELFLCGYNIRPEDRVHVAVTQADIESMIKPIATKYSIALLVPYAEKIVNNADNKMYDSMILIDHTGTTLYNYRKTQLWGKDEKTVWQYPYVAQKKNKNSNNKRKKGDDSNSNGGTNSNAASKNEENNNGENDDNNKTMMETNNNDDNGDNDDPYKVVVLNGIRIGMLNCYEAEFPELNRILALRGAQIIIIPTAADVGTYNNETKTWSNWAYPDVARTVIPTTAYQNNCFVAYVNHSLYQFRSDGTTLSGIYLGNTTIADPTGNIMAIADNVETMIVVDCIPSHYGPVHPNGQSNFMQDRRPELYQQLTSMSYVRNDTGATSNYPQDPNVAE